MKIISKALIANCQVKRYQKTISALWSLQQNVDGTKKTWSKVVEKDCQF